MYTIKILHNATMATRIRQYPKLYFNSYKLIQLAHDAVAHIHRRGLAKELDEAGLAVRIVSMLFERPLVEELETESTSEMLRVPFLTHSSDALA